LSGGPDTWIGSRQILTQERYRRSEGDLFLSTVMTAPYVLKADKKPGGGAGVVHRIASWHHGCLGLPSFLVQKHTVRNAVNYSVCRPF
jgi:hypothetical protein